MRKIDKPCIMHDRKMKLVLPVSPRAFSATQNSVTKLRDMYADTIFLTNDGQVLSIRSITKIGLYGKSFISKCISALTGNIDIKVELKQAGSGEFEDFRKNVLEALRVDKASEEATLGEGKDLAELEIKVNEAMTAEEIFDLIGLPDDLDCLDSL